MNRIFDLSGKVAVVTGGSGYLGFSIAKILSDFNAKTIIISRNQERLKQCVSKDKRLKWYSCDLTDENAVESLIEDITSEYSKIDILVNAAYCGGREKPIDVNTEILNTSIINPFSMYFFPIKYIGEQMKHQKGGSIINIASLWSSLAPDNRMYLDLGVNPSIHYFMVKGGLLQMSRYLASLWAEYGIRVNCVSPGLFPKKRGKERLDYISELEKRIPLGRIGVPKDLEGTIILLASDASSYITGQNITVDGGYSVW